MASNSKTAVNKIGKEEINTLLEKAGNLINTDSRRGLAFAQRALKLSARTGVFLSECNYMMSRYSNQLGKYSDALAFILESLRLADQKDSALIARINSYLGNIYYKLYKPKQAIYHLLSALKIQEKYGESKDLLVTFMRIANFYISFAEDQGKALKYYRKAFKASVHTGNIEIQVQSLGGIASVALEAGKNKQAVRLLERAREILKSEENAVALSNICFELAKAYFKTGDFRNAIDNYTIFLEQSVKSKDINSMFSGYANLSLCYFELDDQDSAEYYIKKANSLLDKISDVKLAYTFFMEYSDMFARKEDYRRAFEYFRRYHNIYTQSLKETLQREVSELRSVFERDQAEKEAEILRLKAAELRKEIESKNRELNLTANYLVRKNEFVSNFAVEIRKLAKDPSFNPVERSGIYKLISLAEQKERINTDFETFETNLNRMNLKFTEKLSRKYPSLSKMELRLCSLMMINLDTKDIAKLLSISARTVENHRHHIIKKLNLPKGQSLHKFVDKIN